MTRVRLLDCDFDALDLRQALDLVAGYVDSGTFHSSCGVNVDQLVKMRRDPAFRDLVSRSDLITADGTPVVWASRLLGRPLPARLPSIDLFEALLGEAAQRGWGVYLLGARAEVLEEAAEVIRRRHPILRIAGTRHGYFADAEQRDVAAEIRDAKPDLLFVAMSSPRKERFVHHNRDLLERVPFVLGVGGALDIAAGRTRRAPRWMADAGVEWLYRLAQEPRRLAKRYLWDDMAFVGMVGREFLAERLTPSRGPRPSRRRGARRPRS